METIFAHHFYSQNISKWPMQQSFSNNSSCLLYFFFFFFRQMQNPNVMLAYFYHVVYAGQSASKTKTYFRVLYVF